MKEIVFDVEEITGNCTPKCPNGWSIYVGSAACRSCKSNVGQDDEKYVVTCKMNKEWR